MRAAAPGHRRGQSGCCAPGATALAPSSQTLGGIACGPQRIVAQAWIAALEGGRNQSHSYARRDGLSSGKRNKERRAKTARRIFAFTQPKASALKLHHPDMANSKSTSKSKTPEQQCSRALELPISNGASPIASALGIRLGATPRGRIHSNIHPPALPRKADISIWQKSGHFYLALTYRRYRLSRRRARAPPESQFAGCSLNVWLRYAVPVGGKRNWLPADLRIAVTCPKSNAGFSASL